MIFLLAAVLALASADSATVGASAIELRQALHINNFDIGLLIAVTSIVAAVASIPFGVLADRGPRTTSLGLTIFLWGAAMVWSATVSSFGRLLLARMFLGVVTAAAGPIVASLVGDLFSAAERGKIYGYILSGELTMQIGHDRTVWLANWLYRPVWVGTGGASRIKRMESRRLALALGSSGSSGSEPAFPATS